MRATDGTMRIALFDGEHRRFVARIAAVSTCVALTIAGFLLTRRVAGAFSTPLPISRLLATAVLVVTWAVVVRELSSRSSLYITLAVIVLLVFALACSYPGTRVIDWLVWPAAMFAAVWSPPQLKSPFRILPLQLKEGRGEGESPGIKVSLPCPLPEGLGVETSGEQLLQQLTRIRAEDGHEAIRGVLVGEFARGERQATLYTAFCPPFERLPRVDVNVADDSDATVKLAQVLHNGAQLDVRLPHPADKTTSIAIEFFAADAEPI
jgi:hypothetical protein